MYVYICMIHIEMIIALERCSEQMSSAYYLIIKYYTTPSFTITPYMI